MDKEESLQPGGLALSQLGVEMVLWFFGFSLKSAQRWLVMSSCVFRVYLKIDEKCSTCVVFFFFFGQSDIVA